MIKILLKYSFLAAISWTIIIFVLCCTPGKYVPTAHWLELLSFDKFVHASIFFTLTFLWLLVGFKKNKLSLSFMIFIIIACIGYGGLLEMMQATVFSQRSGDWLDFIANSFGCLMGLWFFRKNKYRLNFAN
ncbi:MAG: VanZ family protein [Bacteroidetes bacterium]|nr:VanZ family protein [Bacteroidota bacterium]